MKTITLTVVINDEHPMRERIVRGAIGGIMQSLRRVAETVSLDESEDEVKP